MNCGVTGYPNVNDHDAMKQFWMLS